MKNLAAPFAIIALLLSVTPAMAEEVTVKVDPSKIQKLTEETAPKPSLVDRLAAPFKNIGKPEDDMPPYVDPRKTPPPKRPPVAKGEVPKIDAKAVPFKPVEAPKPAVESPTVLPKPDMKQPSAVKVDGKPTPPPKPTMPSEPVSKNEKNKAEDVASAPSAETGVVAAEPAAEEKTGLGKYLPW